MTSAVTPRLLPRDAAASAVRRPFRRFLAIAGFTLFATMVVSAFLMPLLYMTSTAFKDPNQTSTPGAPLYPATPDTFTFQGEEYPVYQVPTDDGLMAWALIER